MNKLKVNWDPQWNPRLFGVLFKGEWYISNQHVIARREYWEESETLDVLCRSEPQDECAGWTYGGKLRVGVPFDTAKAAVIRALYLPAKAQPGVILPLMLTGCEERLFGEDQWQMTIRTELTGRVLVAFGEITRILDLRYVRPFADCELRSEAEPGDGPVYAVLDDEIHGVIMPMREAGLPRESRAVELARELAGLAAPGDPAETP